MFQFLQYKNHYCSINQDCTRNRPATKLPEPECVEFISALAAGNQARLLLDIASGGMSAPTLALAIAARHAGGRLVCIRREREALEEIKEQLEALDLGDVCELKCGEPRDVVEQYENVDFAVVDHRMRECMEVLFAMNINPKGSVVVVSNLFHGSRVIGSTAFGQMMRGKGSGNKTEVLPIGDGMEITRIMANNSWRRRRSVRKSCKRTFMVYEECPEFIL